MSNSEKLVRQKSKVAKMSDLAFKANAEAIEKVLAQKEAKEPHSVDWVAEINSFMDRINLDKASYEKQLRASIKPGSPIEGVPLDELFKDLVNSPLGPFEVFDRVLDWEASPEGPAYWFIVEQFWQHYCLSLVGKFNK